MDIIDLKIGSTIMTNKRVYTVTDLLFNEASCKATLEDLLSGEVKEETIAMDNDVELVVIEDKQMQFSYEDNGLYYFMDIETYKQYPYTRDMVGDYMKYIAEDSIVTMTIVKDKLIKVKPNDVIMLEVSDIDERNAKIIDGVKYNVATLITGLIIYVPCDIIVGDKVKINTTNDTFVEKM